MINVFPSRAALIKYTRTTKRFAPLAQVKRDMLSPLLRNFKKPVKGKDQQRKIQVSTKKKIQTIVSVVVIGNGMERIQEYYEDEDDEEYGEEEVEEEEEEEEEEWETVSETDRE